MEMTIPRELTTKKMKTTILPTATAATILLFALPLAAPAQFTYTANNATITIAGHTGHRGDVTIPDTVNGLPVTGIGGNAFPTRACNYYCFVELISTVAHEQLGCSCAPASPKKL